MMRKKVTAITLALYLTGGIGTAYATDTVTTTPTAADPPAVVTISEPANNSTIQDSAGILPTSPFYRLERKIEELQLAITKSEEKLAALEAKLATERAAEAVIMTNEGQDEIASKTLGEYQGMLASAAAHISHAIEAQDKAVKTLESLNKSYKQSEAILQSLLEKATPSAKEAIENALNQQDKALGAVNSFYAAKKALFAAKDQLEAAKKELKAAKEGGDAAAIKAAEDKVKAAEALKDELESLKDSAETAKEEVKHLAKQAEKKIELAFKHLEKADAKMEKAEEKAADKAGKEAKKADKEDERAKEKSKKAEIKAKKAAQKAHKDDDDNDEEDED